MENSISGMALSNIGPRSGIYLLYNSFYQKQPFFDMTFFETFFIASPQKL